MKKIKTEVSACKYSSDFRKFKPVFTATHLDTLSGNLFYFITDGSNRGVKSFKVSDVKTDGYDNILGYSVSYKDKDGTNTKIVESLVDDG